MDEEQRKLAEHMIEELKHPSKPLTDWERNFHESVSDQFDRKRWLSQKQMDILERIYAEKTS